MRMFNADGTEAEMCGNAVRCIGGYSFRNGYVDKNEFIIQTKSGPKTITVIRDDLIQVSMGKPILDGKKIPTVFDKTPIIDQEIHVEGFTGKFTAISMGNPHAVFFLDGISQLDLEKIGPLLEFHKYFPERVNSEFVEIISRTEVNFRVWERGSGETWACGTGASAALVAGMLKGVLDAKVLFHLKGGDLLMQTDKQLSQVWKIGPWEIVGTGLYTYKPENQQINEKKQKPKKK
jgi:diaminopimelate epimerase